LVYIDVIGNVGLAVDSLTSGAKTALIVKNPGGNCASDGRNRYEKLSVKPNARFPNRNIATGVTQLSTKIGQSGENKLPEDLSDPFRIEGIVFLLAF
jgi:hypothetical protein